MAFEKFPEPINNLGSRCEVQKPRPEAPGRHYVVIYGNLVTDPHELSDLAQWCNDAVEFMFDEDEGIDSPVIAKVAALLEKELNDV